MPDLDLHIIFRDYFKYFLKDRQLLRLPSYKNARLESNMVSFTPQYPMQIDAVFMFLNKNQTKNIVVFKDVKAIV